MLTQTDDDGTDGKCAAACGVCNGPMVEISGGGPRLNHHWSATANHGITKRDGKASQNHCGSVLGAEAGLAAIYDAEQASSTWP